MTTIKRRIIETLWDLWCVGTVIGIWPRYIEPNLLLQTNLDIQIENLPPELDGSTILQFSDLHLSKKSSKRFLSKLLKTINSSQADLIVFTGDFISNSTLDSPELLRSFFECIENPYGCFAILGNHDYAESITLTKEGHYDLLDKEKEPEIIRGLKMMISSPPKIRSVTKRAQNIEPHNELIDLLKSSSIHLLHNQTRVIPFKGSFLNICGLGEHTLGRVNAKEAFTLYDKRYPGIILVHNPDAIPSLQDWPGDLILAGHTHGGQINLPWLWQRCSCMEQEHLKSGKIEIQNKTIYVNRGVGSSLAFRWFAPPEVTLITLRSKK